MDLGVYSTSLAVKDLAASMAFYEKLGFAQVGGDPAHHYVVLANDSTVLGLFEGMFDKNILTFNPGWARPGQEHPEAFTDVRELAKAVEAAGLRIVKGNVDESAEGPAHFVLEDPDGNPILIDQHR